MSIFISFFMLYLRLITVVLVQTPTPSFVDVSTHLLNELVSRLELDAHPSADPVGATSFVFFSPGTF